VRRIHSSAVRFGTALAALFSVVAISAATYNTSVRWNDVRQRITGFGAATAWQGNAIMSKGATVLNQLFDTTTGAGLSMIRGQVPGNAGDYQVMQEAKKRGVKIFWSAPWKPPSQYVSSDNNAGNPLLPQYYQDYANYLSNFVTTYKNQYGIDLMGISVQNEPHFNAPWDHCVYTGAQIRDFIKNNLGPTFARDGQKATIIMPESNWDQRGWADPTLADTAALKYVGVVALHFYQDNKATTPYPAVKLRNKELWESECSNMGGNDMGMNGAMDWVKVLHGLLTQAEVNAYHYWWLYSSGGSGEGLIYSSGPSKRLWTLGNWSRFVRPGWRMIGNSSYYSPDSLVGISTFRDTSSGKFAIVAVSFSYLGQNSDLRFNFSGFKANNVTPYVTDATNDLSAKNPIAVESATFSASIPPASVTTFVGMGTPLGPADVRADSFVANPTLIIPGGKATLSWSTANATSVSIDNGVGAVGSSGAQDVTPSSTTTYALAAQGPNGPITHKVTVTVETPRTPENPSPVTNGLNYWYYETQNETFDVAALTPTKTGTVNNFDMSVRSRNNDLSFKFAGYIDIPTDGVYTFYIRSCDLMRMYIGTTQIAGNGISVWPLHEYSGSIALKAGKHAITVQTHNSYGCGAPVLQVFWKGPGIATKTLIPASVLYRSGQSANAISMLDIPAKSCMRIERQNADYRLNVVLMHAGTIRAKILSSSGKLVRSFYYENAHTGLNPLIFNGKDNRGNSIVPGVYRCVVHTPDGRQLQASLAIARR